MKDTAEAMHAAIVALLASLATGTDGFGPTIPRHRLLSSPAIQSLANAAGAWQRAHNEESR